MKKFLIEYNIVRNFNLVKKAILDSMMLRDKPTSIPRINARTSSGYRLRRFDARTGTLYLIVPKLRIGGYVPFFVVERRRSDQALIQVVQEAFINGVSTRKIERLAKAPGIETLSASQVSEINKGLNEQVEAFWDQPLEEVYPVLWVDVMDEKIRMNGRVVNMAVLIFTGINRWGKRNPGCGAYVRRIQGDLYSYLQEPTRPRSEEGVTGGFRCPCVPESGGYRVLFWFHLVEVRSSFHEEYVTSYLIEYSEDRSTSRVYIHPKDIEDQENELNKAA